MATWQQGINSGGFLAGIGAQNENAPKASDINATLGLIRENNELARSGANNVGLTALRGLAGVADIYKQQQQQERKAAFQKGYADAYASGDREQMRNLITAFPEEFEEVRKGMGYVDDAQRDDFGNLALKAQVASSLGPGAFGRFMMDSEKEMRRLGIPPETIAEMQVNDPQGFQHFAGNLALFSLGHEKYFDIKDQMEGRDIERGKLAETIRSNQAGEALQARGQNLSYQSAMTGHGLAAERLALDKQKFGFEVQQAQKKADELINAAPKLSVNMEKAIEKSAGDAAASRNAADSMTTLADTLEKEKPTPGLFGNAENMFAKLTGQDNYLRDMRIRFNQLANAQATKLLPPGPASDKDIEFARKGIPSETDNPMVMARWLRGMAKMESNNAKFNEFKSEWMSANGSPGQSDRNRNIMGMDVKKGESLNSAAKRFLSSSYGDSQPQQQLSDDELISKYLGEQ
ncbi:acyltransferase [Salmonella enterica subsp. enterica serovar Newport]|uniref:Acyltransferase n=2 Tax=Salmonella enterica TaxID=28901 RepID=A0A747BBY4_SALER|nr:phage DNA ejection protein [Salmonella enterica]EBS3100053.1 acyltransferase [Salmonella enterica subsp. enterica serovar Kentucky]EBZ4927622.1 acyltransferase [Salmonella enterica subsp. enterica serovar Hadar]ECB0058290.1 acyltransferase [Salmonella enterica subsp. enterica serovar Blockley]EAB7566688.1 acyltransferase [Salmonella enterica subsp. enterica serovar Newport]EBO2949736.1 acyltransferase [Salmonella enterica subsp. enterica serovar Newport]